MRENRKKDLVFLSAVINLNKKKCFSIFQIKLIVSLVVTIIGAANGDVSELNSFNLIAPNAVQPCAPDFVGVYPNCRAKPYITPAPKVLFCDEGYYGYPPNCHKPCGVHEVGIYPDCHRIRCPYGSEGDFQPNCTIHQCPYGQHGVYPHCAVIEYTPCPDGLQGYPPHCYKPCDKPYRELLIIAKYTSDKVLCKL